MICSHVNAVLVIPEYWEEIQSVPEATSQGKALITYAANGLDGCSDNKLHCVMSLVYWKQDLQLDKIAHSNNEARVV